MAQPLLTTVMVILVTVTSSALALPAQDHQETRTRMLNGADMDISEVPHQVSISGNNQQCGGAIIGDEWILTAAHCCNVNKTYTVRAGSNFKSKEGQLIESTKIFIHPKYTSETYINDICIIRLKSKLILNPTTVKVAPIASIYPLWASKAKIAGWGHIDTAKTFPTQLRGATITASILDKVFGPIIVPNMASTHFTTAIKPAMVLCQGDSGSGIVDDNGNLFGIASFSSTDILCDSKAINVFTDLTDLLGISEVRKFIKDTAKI